MAKLPHELGVPPLPGDEVHVFHEIEFHGLGQHGGDDRQGVHVLAKQLRVVVGAHGADSAEHLAAAQDGHAQKGAFPVLGARQAAGAVEDGRLVADARHDDGAAAFHNLAGDALARKVDAPALLVLGQAQALVDADMARFPVVQVDHGPRHAHVAGHVVEQAVERRPQVALLRQRLPHGAQQRHDLAPAHAGMAFLDPGIVLFEGPGMALPGKVLLAAHELHAASRFLGVMARARVARRGCAARGAPPFLWFLRLPASHVPERGTTAFVRLRTLPTVLSHALPSGPGAPRQDGGRAAGDVSRSSIKVVRAHSPVPFTDTSDTKEASPMQ